MDYSDFIETKTINTEPTGLAEISELNDMMFDFQRDIVTWALKRGRACIWADCGLGKTLMQLEWAKHVPGKVLILAPLSVAHQTVREGEKFGITNIEYMPEEILNDNNPITNYERLDNFDFSQYTGIVLDESSILKNFTGKIRNDIIERCQNIPFRLACTATPAPNDHMELGNHAEFVGSMSRTEMLSMFFVHDGGETAKWRLKGHAAGEFWKWVCTWAVMVRKPSDLGYEDKGFILPEMVIDHVVIETENCSSTNLFNLEARSLQERVTARRDTIQERSEKVAEIANATDEPVVIWCKMNKEAEIAASLIPGSVNVHGSMTDEQKADLLCKFSDGEIRVMITKPKIAGHGMNWQHCRNVIFLGMNDSWEEYYQSVRRCYRFGQERNVNVTIVTADIEGEVVRNIERKEKDADEMITEMVSHMKYINRQNIKGIEMDKSVYKEADVVRDDYTAMLGDCVERTKEIETNSIDYSIFSPPFASLYTYSNSDRDMGNSKTTEEFYDHFKFLVDDLFRVIKPGRLVSFHCMNLPTLKSRDGYIGIRDFRGDLIKMFQNAGFIFHSEVVIWKDPVIAMQRTKAKGLLHKQVKKDSCQSRQGIPDYLVTMRTPGDNEEPVSGEFEYFCGDEGLFKATKNLSIDIWQRYASPVWHDIRPSNTLQHRSAKEQNDERHICPLQLDVIERGLQLWTNERDLVYSPFMGIGSEGYVVVKNNRRFIGTELKESYYDQAVKNLANVTADKLNRNLF